MPLVLRLPVKVAFTITAPSRHVGSSGTGAVGSVTVTLLSFLHRAVSLIRMGRLTILSLQ